jgi:glycosyltransferase involved in cell wall biosynthesis
MYTKKILILGPPFDYYKGGAEYQYKLIEEYLCKTYKIYYLFRHTEQLLHSKFITYDYRIRKNYKENLPSDSFTIYKLIKKLSPDIIYKQGIDYITAIGAYYAKKNGKSMVLHIASSRDVEKSSPMFGKRILFDIMNQQTAKYVINNSTKIICQATYQDILLRENYGKSCELILPNFHPVTTNKIHKDTSPIIVAWVANLKELKQPEVFIRLAKSFMSTPDVKFMMIGRPALGAWQGELVEQIGRVPNLEYLGELPINQVNDILSKAHILVNTSQYEGFSNTYIQAWMQKVPVVALNSDPDDIIKTKQIGFHSKSFEQLVSDVRALIENKALREVMGEKARSFACRTFSTENISKFENLLAQL